MTDSHEPLRPSFWRGRAGIVLIVFLAVGGLLLAYEHRAHIFIGSWFWIGLLVFCVGIHHFMHGGHGGHGDHSGGGEKKQKVDQGDRP